MSRNIEQPRCVACHLANYTQGQIGYAEQHGTPLAKSSLIYCRLKREYVFKNDSCKEYIERHQETR